MEASRAQVSHGAFHAAAGEHLAVRENRDVVARAVAAVRDFPALWQTHQPLLVQKERPQVVFELEGRLRASVRLVPLPASFKEGAVLARRDVEARVERFPRARGAVSSDCVNVRSDFVGKVDDARDFVHVRLGDRAHQREPHPGFPDSPRRLHRRSERAFLAEAVVRALKPVERELVLYAARVFHPPAHVVGQVEGISHHAESDFLALEEREQVPEVGMENRVAAGEVDVRLASDFCAERADFCERALKFGAAR